MTSPSAAARGRGGRSRTPSSRGGSRAPGTGPAVLWTSHTGRETARHRRGVLSGAPPRQPPAPGGDSASSSGIQLLEAHAPWERPLTLLWEPRSCVFCSLDVDVVPRSNISHLLLVIFPPAVRTGLAGAPPFSHLTAASPQPSTTGRGLGHILAPSPPPRRQ